MTEKHPHFQQPDDPNEKIWRYLSLEKLIHLLLSKKIFFSRVDKFEDPFEGSHSKKSKQIENERIEELQSNYPFLSEHLSGTEQRRQKLQKSTFVNCWHLSEHESFAMWKIYTNDNFGVAIQTTYQTLWNALPNKYKHDYIYMGLVQYYDSNHDEIHTSDAYSSFMNKLQEFEFEHEVRAIIHFETENPPPGIYVKITDSNFKNLIQNIYISPFTPAYFKEVITDVIGKYGLDKGIVKKSFLDNNPIY